MVDPQAAEEPPFCEPGPEANSEPRVSSAPPAHLTTLRSCPVALATTPTSAAVDTRRWTFKSSQPRHAPTTLRTGRIRPHHQFDRVSGLYSEDELLQWQHLQSVPTMQRLLTADLTQGVCHEKEGCTLIPIPRAPSYALSNLEQSMG